MVVKGHSLGILTENQKSSFDRCLVLLVLLGASSLIAYVAKANSIEPLKPLAVLMQLASLYVSFEIISRTRRLINFPLFVFFAAIVSGFPILRIAFDVFSIFSFKSFTDGFLLLGAYYQLPIVGMAIAASVASFPKVIGELILRYLMFVMPLAAILLSLGLLRLNSDTVGFGYALINNVVFPASILLFFRSNKKEFLVGLLGIAALAYLSAQLASRSYLLVSAYIVCFSLLTVSWPASAKLIAGVLVVIMTNLLFGPELMLLIEGGSVADAQIMQKLRLTELSDLWERYRRSGNVAELYFWEGNSRSRILIDAFSNFSLSDYIWGRGVFATYESFVERGTIEIGVAQELFWFGLVLVVPQLTLFIFSISKNLAHGSRFAGRISTMFASVAAIKMLDSFVFGMPTHDVYNLLAWAAAMSVLLRQPVRIRSEHYSIRPGNFSIKYTL